MIVMWLCIGSMTQNIQYSTAKQFYENVIKQLEDNEFEKMLIESCKKEAKEKGYDLEIVLYEEKQSKDAKVTMRFTYLFPIIQKKRTCQIEGYAR